MKRIAFYAGLALWLVAASCTQHDNQKPDTSGVDPQNPNKTTTTDTGGGVNVGTNMNNGTYNTQGDSMADSSANRQR